MGSSMTSGSGTRTNRDQPRLVILGPGAKIILCLSTIIAVSIVVLNLHVFLSASRRLNSSAEELELDLDLVASNPSSAPSSRHREINVLIIDNYDESSLPLHGGQRLENCSRPQERKCFIFRRKPEAERLLNAVVFDDARCSKSWASQRFCSDKMAEFRKEEKVFLGLLETHPSSVSAGEEGENIFNFTISYLPDSDLASTGRVRFRQKSSTAKSTSTSTMKTTSKPKAEATTPVNEAVVKRLER